MTATVFSFRDQARSSKIKQIKKKQFYFYSYPYIIFEFRNLQVTTLDSLSNLSLLFILYVFHHNQLLNGKTYTRGCLGARAAGCPKEFPKHLNCSLFHCSICTALSHQNMNL